MVSTDKHAKSNPRRRATAALQAFFTISQFWHLTESEQRQLLGSPPKTLVDAWRTNKSASALNNDVVTRISYILSIYKSLNQLLQDQQASNAWIKKSNSAPLFSGTPALTFLLKGDLEHFRQVDTYLKEQIG